MHPPARPQSFPAPGHRASCATLSALLVASLAACGGAGTGQLSSANDNQGDDPHDPRALVLRLAGWPRLAGLGVKVNGRWVRASHDDGEDGFLVPVAGKVTFFAGDIELATISARETVTLFDLVPGHQCDSGTELAKVVSALFALDLGQGQGALVLPPASGKATVRIADLDEAHLLALELAAPAGRSVPLAQALLLANRALDTEAWSENVPSRTEWTNDFYELSHYLDRVLAQLALGGNNAPAAFGSATLNEIYTNPTAFRSQGLVYLGDKVVFSWRYGLQVTDLTYLPLKTVPWAIPLDIFQAQIAGADNPFNPDFKVNKSHDFDGLSHIGDIDYYNGRIYAPIEDENLDVSKNAFIALYDQNLNYTGEKHKLPPEHSVDGVPWVAVDPARGLLYTVDWDPAKVLHIYDLATVTYQRDLPLVAPLDGNGKPITIKRIQGAKVWHGMLYGHADTKDTANAGLNTKTKRVWKIDPVTGFMTQVTSYDMPNRSENEGLAFSDQPEGEMHLLVLDPYDSAFSNAGYELSGDDWNVSSSLRHYRRTQVSLRDQLCGR